ncbi:type II secretion system protein [Vampirovibrio chlorellavorus]|uniref:type II secretion system protein n=1 Tax=Vampirovibrio chlorellavorus TaxID=758823 RepID=UPI0026F01D04|nr:type II secretion system protein [Vampirovibrio chlorellavorus]
MRTHIQRINSYRTLTGFTLAELLISLAILGVIATFTIPKILSTQQDARNSAIAKEAAAMISEAYQRYSATNQVTASTKVGDLTPYMNYVSTGNTAVINANGGAPVGASVSCSLFGGQCLLLHNGARLLVVPTISFAGTDALNALWFHLDPDGTANNTNAVVFFLYYNGRIKSYSTIDPNTVSSDGVRSADVDPSWFSWN